MLDKTKKRAVLALGFFDGVHVGHKKVISLAKNMAQSENATLVAVTFNGNLKGFFKSGEKTIFSLDERIFALKNSGVDEVLLLPLTSEFLSLTAEEFLDWLNEKYNVIGYATGDDYTCGKGGQGNVIAIKNYANIHGGKVETASGEFIDGERVSSTAIKRYLQCGNVKKANEFLGEPYSVTGEVLHGRTVGKTLGFPTVNMLIDNDKIKLKDGVYAGKVILDNVTYRTIINYGARPTFNLDEKLIEAHIIGFNGNLYGQTITLKFSGFIRSVMRFNGSEELIKQLEKDVRETESGKYD